MESTVANATDILLRYLKIRHQSELICEPLSPEDFVVQPVVDVSPPKWHLAHTTWFFETFILKEYKTDYSVYNQDYNYLFNSYYESAGTRMLRTDRGNITRPGVDEVFQYRQYVDKHMSELLQNTLSSEARRILEIGLHHEQQHQELLVTDIKYILGHNPLFPVYLQYALETGTNPVSPGRFLEISEGTYEIGYSGNGFCFDNEKECHQVYLEPFSIMNRLVTNAEYLEFIAAGGYENFKYWLMEGWEWVKASGIKAPLYWYFADGQWQHYNLTGLASLEPDSPVTHISFYEADAFARWKGFRLPTEFEWEVACTKLQPTVSSAARFLEDGSLIPGQAYGDDFQFLGNAWEWTGSPYRPYPRYRHEEGALGEYNGKFMINQMVLRGGSCATPRDHIRKTYRNFFHPHLRWQFNGIRLASDLP